jgi:hypothetical protein
MWLVLYFRFILNSDHDSAAGDRTSPNSTKSSCNARPDHTFGSGVEIARSLTNVRFTPESRQAAHCSVCPLSAKTGLMHRSKKAPLFDHRWQDRPLP